MKGKYLILALAIVVQGVHAMSPAQEAQNRTKLTNIMDQLPQARTDAQAAQLKAQGDAIIDQLTGSGRPTKRLKSELADSYQLYQSAQPRAAGRVAAGDAAQRGQARQRIAAQPEVPVVGSPDQKIRSTLTNLVKAINESMTAATALINEKVFVDSANVGSSFTNPQIRAPRNLLKLNRDAIENVTNIVKGHFDQFTDLIDDLYQPEKNSLRSPQAFASFKAQAKRVIDTFVAQLQATILNNLKLFIQNADSTANRRRAQTNINEMVDRIDTFYKKTNDLGITDKNIAEFRAEYRNIQSNVQ